MTAVLLPSILLLKRFSAKIYCPTVMVLCEYQLAELHQMRTVLMSCRGRYRDVYGSDQERGRFDCRTILPWSP